MRSPTASRLLTSLTFKLDLLLLQEYMTSVAEAIEAATEEIYITDWWLSPEVYLRRGLEFDENLRFDRLLAKKAVRKCTYKIDHVYF